MRNVHPGEAFAENPPRQIRLITAANTFVKGVLTQFSRIREHADDCLIAGVAYTWAGGRRAADGSLFQIGIEVFIDLEPGTFESQDALVQICQLHIHEAGRADRSDLGRVTSIIHRCEADSYLRRCNNRRPDLPETNRHGDDHCAGSWRL